MTAQQKAIAWALGELKAPCLMGMRGSLRFDRDTKTLLPHGHDFSIWDCSGLVCGAIAAGGGKDMRGTHNAQMLFDECRALVQNEPELPGDLAFYGSSEKHIIHVALLTVGGKCISADGATWGVVSLEVAKASRCMVRLHESVHFRGDFVAVRRNIYLSNADGVSR